MIGLGGQILDYILVDGLTLYQAEAKMRLYPAYCFDHLIELSEWYRRRSYLKTLERHARIAEAVMSDPTKSLSGISDELGVSYNTVLNATTRYLKKPEQSLTLKSKV